MKGFFIFILIATTCVVVTNWGWPTGGALEYLAFVTLLFIVYLLGLCFFSAE